MSRGKLNPPLDSSLKNYMKINLLLFFIFVFSSNTLLGDDPLSAATISEQVTVLNLDNNFGAFAGSFFSVKTWKNIVWSKNVIYQSNDFQL